MSVEENGETRASMMVVPAYFRWPFMARNDVQLAYVMTPAASRRQGWGSYLVDQGIARLAQDDRRFWYVTDTDNAASQKLAENAGFVLVGTAPPRSSMFRRVRLARQADRQGAE